MFEQVDPEGLAKALNAWLDNAERCGGRNVNIDGKTICGSKNADHKAYHVVSAWVGENAITLEEIMTPEKSNEITAIPELLEMIDVEGDIITIDAMGCQTAIAAKIIERKADYVLALKGNQQNLCEAVSDYFDWIEKDKPKEEKYEMWRSDTEKCHGRIEKREIICANANWLPQKELWEGLCTIVRCKNIRIIGDTETVATRYYISSFDGSAKNFGEIIRGHWSIENHLHWALDVTFGEDSARAKKDNSPLNMNVMRKIALLRLKQINIARLRTRPQ